MSDKAFIQYTIDVWQPCSKEQLTETDALEIIANMAGLIKVLLQIEERYEAAYERTSSG